jgi:nitrate reductase gamma subunit
VNALVALGLVLGLALAGFVGGLVPALRPLFGVALPYAAAVALVAGIVVGVVRWTGAPVPFRIPTTAGQQRSLPWIRPARLDNPSSALGAAGRVALEVLTFRSLLRNTRAQLHEGPRLSYGEDKLLWLAALAFHWSLLVVLVRHLRLVLEPVPGALVALEAVDGFFEVGTPALYLTDVALVAALAWLAARRFVEARVRFVSLVEDYLLLGLLGGIVVTGLLMRYVAPVDVAAVKAMALGLVTFAPVVPAAVGPLVFVHVTLVSVLAACLPGTKLVHMVAVFLAPTRNLPNDNRRRRHLNPWNGPRTVHTYAEWEDENRDELRVAGLPREKD